MPKVRQAIYAGLLGTRGPAKTLSEDKRRAIASASCPLNPEEQPQPTGVTFPAV